MNIEITNVDTLTPELQDIAKQLELDAERISKLEDVGRVFQTEEETGDADTVAPDSETTKVLN